MKRDYIDFQDRSFPVGYLITFRCYGTWLHGDERGSVDRYHRAYGTPGLPSSQIRRQHDRDLLKQPPVKLGSRDRPVVESAIRERNPKLAVVDCKRSDEPRSRGGLSQQET